MPARLVDRHPTPATEALVEQLAPPPLFAAVRFGSYQPDPDQPSQAAALAAMRQFASSVAEPAGRRWFARRGGRQGPSGIYRHRGLPVAPPSPSAEQVVRAAARPGASLDDFPALLEHLAALHPTRYGALLDGISEVCLLGLVPAPDQNVALRLVVLADRLYDRQLPVSASGVPVDRLFSEEMLASGYRKKYRRAISRLVALARLSSASAV